MKIDYESHYNDDYWTGRKTYSDNQGRQNFYHGPALQWEGFGPVANALSTLLPRGTLLDIGCGGGDLANFLRVNGFDSYGVDISDYALKNCTPQMNGRLAKCDITNWPDSLQSYHAPEKELPERYDVVISTDLLEHIYAEDIDKTFESIYARSKKWFFFLVATAQPPNSIFADPNKIEFVHKKGEVIPPQWEATAVSGHVNVRMWQYWVKKFQQFGLKVRWDLMYLFQAMREKDTPWKNTGGWNMECTYFLEKP